MACLFYAPETNNTVHVQRHEHNNDAGVKWSQQKGPPSTNQPSNNTGELPPAYYRRHGCSTICSEKNSVKAHVTGTRRRMPQGMPLRTASPIRSLCPCASPPTQKPWLWPDSITGCPSAGRMWLYLVVRKKEVPRRIKTTHNGLARNETVAWGQWNLFGGQDFWETSWKQKEQFSNMVSCDNDILFSNDTHVWIEVNSNSVFMISPYLERQRH